MKRGFSLIEILIAMAIGLLAIGAVLIAGFGDQSLIAGGETNAEAVTKAQQLLEQEQALARQDFNLVNPVPTTTDGVYQKSVTVTLLPDYVTKLVTALIAWTGDRSQTVYTKISSLVTNLDNVDSPNTCNSVLSGDWSHPHMTSYEFGKDLLGDSSSDFLIDSIDLDSNKLYIAGTVTRGTNKNTFFIFDVSSNPENPVLEGQLDNNSASKVGLNAIQTAGNYAYVANAYDANFSTCTPQPGGGSAGGGCAQLQIIDVGNPLSPRVALNYLIPTSTPPYVLGNMAGSGQAVGKSVFYNNGYIYLGLSKTASGPEFNTIDVRDPLNPVWVGSYAVGRSINRIFVKDNYAYLATDDNARELLILDVQNPSSPTPVGLFNAPGTTGFGYGNIISVVGDTAYLGRTYDNSTPELYILNGTNPRTTLSILGSEDIGTNLNPDSINGIVIRDYLAFLITNNEFQIWKISDPTDSTPYATPLTFPSSGGGNASGTAIDCEQNYSYVGSLPSGNLKGSLSIVGPGP